MTKQLIVLILGYGEMGRAMQCLLEKKHRLDIWDKYPQAGFESVVLEDAVTQADVILFCLHVNPHREVAEQIAPHIKHTCLCLSIAKGLDEAGQTAAQIFDDVFSSEQSFALLYGPMISEEIRAGRPAFAQLGSEELHLYERVSELFHDTGLYIEHSSDITGISWSVILKNVYAMAFGMADELRLGDNMRGFLAVTALHELDQIVRKMGGQSGSPFHLAGLGDLITTATSEDSHHHEVGRMLARGERADIEGEGVHTLEMVVKHQLFNMDRYPLFALIHDVVSNPGDVREKINVYLKQVYG